MLEAEADTDRTSPPGPARHGWGLAVFECLLLVTVCFLVAGTPPPDVNEAHYLGKARHYWDPSFCRGDTFLESQDAHLVFYWSFGWVTSLVSLPAAAWIGRVLTWTLLALGWRRLSWSIWPQPLVAVLAGAALIALTRWTPMAGEWLVGGVEAKGFAFAACLMALADLYVGRWPGCIIWFGVATFFHVLVGGWALVTLGFAWLAMGRERPVGKSLVVPGMVAFVLAAVSVVPALLLSGSDAEVALQAYHIYVAERLDHHLLAQAFPVVLVLRHAAAWLVWAALSWWTRHDLGCRRLSLWVAGSGVVAFCGILLSLLWEFAPAWTERWLRFYWFRAADVWLSLGLVVSGICALKSLERKQSPWTVVCQASLVIMIGLWMTGTFWWNQRDFRPRAMTQSRLEQDDDWLAMCDWVRMQTRADARFITPRLQQTFKWYAQRAEVVNWKDVPQDSASLVEWWRVFHEVYPPGPNRRTVAQVPAAAMLRLAKKYQADYVVLDIHSASARLPWKRVYPPSGTAAVFEIYEVPDAVSDPGSAPAATLAPRTPDQAEDPVP